MATLLAGRGWTIVSGLAKGIDTIAHRAALTAGARTVAILGNGLDTIYPTVNRHLAEEIIAAGGLLLSEQPPGTEAIPRNLVQRDRLQSGMSVATIVFETSATGGAMHTARFAREQQRLLVCPVPPGKYADVPSTTGNRVLLEDEGTLALSDRSAYPSLLDRLDTELRRLHAAAP